MKITKEYIRMLIKEALKKLDKDGNVIRVGPPDDLPPYHDSTKEDGGYVSLKKKKKKTKLYKQKGNDTESYEVD